jgi:hypothetical protein
MGSTPCLHYYPLKGIHTQTYSVRSVCSCVLLQLMRQLVRWLPCWLKYGLLGLPYEAFRTVGAQIDVRVEYMQEPSEQSAIHGV